MGGEPPVQLLELARGLGGPLGPLPGAAAGPVAALGVEAAGAAGSVLTVEPSLEPAELSGLVVQLGAEGLLQAPVSVTTAMLEGPTSRPIRPSPTW